MCLEESGFRRAEGRGTSGGRDRFQTAGGSVFEPEFRRRSARGLALARRAPTVERAQREAHACHVDSDSRREHTRNWKGFANWVTRQRPLS